MNVDTDAMLAAMKMAGQDVAAAQRMMAALRAVRTLHDNPNPDPMTLMGMMAQLNPKYNAMAALAKALIQGGKEESKEAPTPSGSEPFVQRNHFEEEK